MGDIFGDFRRLVMAVLNELAAAGALPAGLDFARVAVEPPRDPSHGDLSSNAAMILAGQVKRSPMELAQVIGENLVIQTSGSADNLDGALTFEVAKPGFINIRLDAEVWH